MTKDRKKRKTSMKRVLSGIQPSGRLHLGNYFGMMNRMIQYQEHNDLYCFIVNYHALTSLTDRVTLEKNTLDAVIDFLALGLDPEKTTFWVQSDVPEVTELTWLLSTVTGMGLLERSTSYKDKLTKGVAANVGLFTYPILMAADILCFGADLVPIGKDQKQHLEITRDIAIRFNQIFGETFIVPEPDIDKSTQLVPGLDGQKMSKSYHNTIPLFAEEKYLRKRVMSIVTDSTDIDQPKGTDSPLFQLYSLFLNDQETRDLADRFATPGLRYGDVKKELFEKIWTTFEPFRNRRDYLVSHTGYVRELLNSGAAKASRVAAEYLSAARNAMGLNY